MRQVRTTGQFDRDYSHAVKRGMKIEKLDALMMMLINEDPLPPRNRDHALKGKFKGFRDCHIEPDWLLIYKVDGEVITFERTGGYSGRIRPAFRRDADRHSDLMATGIPVGSRPLFRSNSTGCL